MALAKFPDVAIVIAGPITAGIWTKPVKNKNDVRKKLSLKNYTGLFEYGIQTGSVSNVQRFDVLPNTLDFARSIGVSSRLIDDVQFKGKTFDELFFNRPVLVFAQF